MKAFDAEAIGTPNPLSPLCVYPLNAGSARHAEVHRLPVTKNNR
jgi:hypothetical protein